jgi:ketosteroid isomerase-like protein
MSATSRLQELLDRHDILDCIHRYCRAVDRLDRDMLLSVYHPDAIDDHGVFVGGREEFAEWAFGYHVRHQKLTHHIVTNHTCELDGDTAHTETYWIFSGINVDAAPSIHFGRYIDRFERRHGTWAIAARTCLSEWHAAQGELAVPPEFAAALRGSGVPTRDKLDPSYMRPLKLLQTVPRAPDEV